MPVAPCSGREACDRLVSISAVPGGDPVAKADPDAYASEWGLCACGAFTCDRCLREQRWHCRCGAAARVFNEADRLRVARGGPRPADGGAAAPAPVAGRVAPPPAGDGAASIGPMLEGVARQIEAELARGNRDKARAMGGLAATVMATQGQQAPAGEVPWLSSFGESFYRWRYFDEGQTYFLGLYELIKRHRRETSDEGERALASALAFQVLAGDVGAGSPGAPAVLAHVTKTFGAGHVLAREVQARLGSPSSPPPLRPQRSSSPPPPLPPPAASSPPPLPPAPPARPAPNAAAAARAAREAAAGGGPRLRASTIMLTNPSLLGAPVAPSVAHYDEPTRRALWVTLAFLDVAFADGAVADLEVEAWGKAMARLGLPDVWTRFGPTEIYEMLDRGVLYDLSTEFAWLPTRERNQMATALVDFMMADGRAEPSELEAVKRITTWINVKIAFR